MTKLYLFNGSVIYSDDSPEPPPTKESWVIIGEKKYLVYSVTHHLGGGLVSLRLTLPSELGAEEKDIGP